MATSTTSYEAGRNAELMAQQAVRRRNMRTPEFFFPKSFDNSRLVKAADPARAQQIRYFSWATTALFFLVMIYGAQHLSVIEGGYQVESEKQTLDQLREENRQLRLSEAQLTDPGRIDRMARELGLAEPQPGQMVRPAATMDAGAPALAQVMPPVAATR